MDKKTYRINGTVVDTSTGDGVAGILVEAWDKDHKCDDKLGNAVTDRTGVFVIHFEEAFFRDSFMDRDPDIYFKLFHNGVLLVSTERSVICNVRNRITEVILPLKAPRRQTGETMFDRLDADLKTEMKTFADKENEIEKHLQNTAMSHLFLRDPAAALAAMKIPVSSRLRKKLQRSRQHADLLAPRTFRLPNGQLVTPKVKVHFTTGKEAGNVR